MDFLCYNGVSNRMHGWVCLFLWAIGATREPDIKYTFLIRKRNEMVLFMVVYLGGVLNLTLALPVACCYWCCK
jgi:hypothetical protein